MSDPVPAATTPLPGVPAQPTAPTTRPTGISILSVIYFIIAGFCILGALAAFTMGAAFGALFGDLGGAFGALIGGVIGFGLLVGAILFGVMGWGLWNRQKWAWWIALVLTVISALGAIGGMVQGDFFGNIIGLAIDAFLIWYFTAPGVERWFGVDLKAPWHKGY